MTLEEALRSGKTYRMVVFRPDGYSVCICSGHDLWTLNCGNLGPCPHCEAAKGNNVPEECYYGYSPIDITAPVKIEPPKEEKKTCTCGSVAAGGTGHSSWCDYEPS